MKTTESNALAIPSKVQPKPTRAEIIDAMTTIEIERTRAKQKEGMERRAVLQKEIEADMMDAHLNAPDPTPLFSIGYINGGKPYGMQIEFDVKSESKPLITKLKEYHSLPDRIREPDRARVRKAIHARMMGMEDKEVRVNRLLADTDSRAALETMLLKISE